MSELLEQVGVLLREMDRDGDGWYGRASSALQDLRARVAELEREAESLRQQLATVQAERDASRKLYNDVFEVVLKERDSLRVHLASLTRRWTTARPTVAGNYWFREGPDDNDPWILRVTEPETHVIAGGEWSDQPIALPEEGI